MDLKQKDIADYLGIKAAFVSMLLRGQRPVSWPLAEKLAAIFPGKSISEWKRAHPAELKQAFAQLNLSDSKATPADTKTHAKNNGAV